MSDYKAQVLLNNTQKQLLEKRINQLGLSHSSYFKYAMLIECIVGGESEVLDIFCSSFKYDQVVNLMKSIDKFSKKHVKKLDQNRVRNI